MANSKVINISAGGIVRGLHYDDFDLGFLGKKIIGRASEILFDEDAQCFYVELPQLTSNTPKFLTGFAGYDQARRFEVMVLETCAWSGVEPAYTGQFYALGFHVRQSFDHGATEPYQWTGTAGQSVNGSGCGQEAQEA